MHNHRHQIAKDCANRREPESAMIIVDIQLLFERKSTLQITSNSFFRFQFLDKINLFRFDDQPALVQLAVPIIDAYRLQSAQTIV